MVTFPHSLPLPTAILSQGTGLIATINEETEFCEEEITYDEVAENGPKFRVKDEYADSWYGSADPEYIEKCQTEGIPVEDIAHLVREWGEGILDQLEEI